MKQPSVYILASKQNGTLYVGVTSDLVARVGQHRMGQGSTFTSRYGVHRLVWFELHGTMTSAIEREKADQEPASYPEADPNPADEPGVE